MDSDIECAAAAVLIAAILKKKKRNKKRKRRTVWVKPWLNRRNELGVYNTPFGIAISIQRG